MFNFQALAGISRAKEVFMANHPKVQHFLDNVNSKGYCPGQEIAIAVRYPDGTEYKTGISIVIVTKYLKRIFRSEHGRHFRREYQEAFLLQTEGILTRNVQMEYIGS